jgi:hypothetical protein
VISRLQSGFPGETPEERRSILNRELTANDRHRRSVRQAARVGDLNQIIPGSAQERALIRVARENRETYLTFLAEETAADRENPRPAGS